MNSQHNSKTGLTAPGCSFMAMQQIRVNQIKMPTLEPKLTQGIYTRG